MCWRIVRIEGDGAIKLLLEDKDAGCSSETLTKISSGIIGYTAYNSKKENDYENGEMNAAFNIFLNGGSFASYDYSISTSTTKTYTAWSEEAKSKLKSTKICLGDITTTYDETGNEFYNYNDNNCVFNGTCTYKKPLYYDSYVRLVGLGQTANATLKCDGEMTTEIQIYPLTADEVVFAGGKAMSSNKKYYMADTRDDYAWWWTISLAETYDYSHPFYARDGLYELSEIGDAHGLRPAVSLASNTTISSGDGTIDNPYIVE